MYLGRYLYDPPFIPYFMTFLPFLPLYLGNYDTTQGMRWCIYPRNLQCCDRRGPLPHMPLLNSYNVNFPRLHLFRLVISSFHLISTLQSRIFHAPHFPLSGHPSFHHKPLQLPAPGNRLSRRTTKRTLKHPPWPSTPEETRFRKSRKFNGEKHRHSSTVVGLTS